MDSRRARLESSLSYATNHLSRAATAAGELTDYTLEDDLNAMAEFCRQRLYDSVGRTPRQLRLDGDRT